MTPGLGGRRPLSAPGLFHRAEAGMGPVRCFSSRKARRPCRRCLSPYLCFLLSGGTALCTRGGLAATFVRGGCDQRNRISQMSAFGTQVVFKRVDRRRGQCESRLGPGGGAQPDRDRPDAGSTVGKPSQQTPPSQGSGASPEQTPHPYLSGEA